MSRFWKIVLLVIAILLVAGIGYRMMGGGKQAGGAAQAEGAGGGRGGDRARDPVPVTAVAAERYTGDAATNLGIVRRQQVELVDASTAEGLATARQWIAMADLVIDALLGTGATGAPRGAMVDLIRAANAAPRANRLAVDIPSGLDADSGDVQSPCFKADATVTFVAEKVGFATDAARAVA